MTCCKSLASGLLVVLLAGAGLGVPTPETPKKEVKKDGKPTALSPDQRLSASAEDKVITVVDLGNVVPQVRMKMMTNEPVRALAYSPDGKLLAAAGDQMVSMWDGATGKQILVVQHGQAATGLQFSPDGSQLTVTTKTGQVILDPRTGRVLANVGARIIRD